MSNSSQFVSQITDWPSTKERNAMLLAVAHNHQTLLGGVIFLMVFVVWMLSMAYVTRKMRQD